MHHWTDVDELTIREHEILSEVAKGKSNKEIAFEKNLSVKTVENHIHSILGKLAAPNRTAAAVYALIRRLIDPNSLV